MAHQIHNLALRLTTKNYVYSLLALGLALGAAIMGIPSGGGGGIG